MRKFLCSSVAMLALAACKTPGGNGGSALQSAPAIGGENVPQGGAIVVNNCNAGGHTGKTAGLGWTFDPKQGCYLDCGAVKPV